jgi:hypothetical protein
MDGGGRLAPDGVNKLIGKPFRGHVHDLLGRIVLDDEIADGVHQVGFTETGASVDKKRII